MSQTARPVEVISVLFVEADAHGPTLSELQNVYAMLRKADTNGDGQLSADEVRAARQQAIEARVKSMFDRCDADNDGRISRSQARGPLAMMFDRADKNRDGYLTKDECAECCSQQAKQSGGNGGASKDK